MVCPLARVPSPTHNKLSAKAERPLTRASAASGFSVEVIESKSSRRSAVRSSAWLDLFSFKIQDQVVWAMEVSLIALK